MKKCRRPYIFSRRVDRFGDGVQVGDIPYRPAVRDGAGGPTQQLLWRRHRVLPPNRASKNDPHHSKSDRLQP